VVDAAARVTIRQSYRNLETVPLEVVYTFPLDEGAAVCGFEATVDGVRYVGRAMERDEAFKEYDDALEAGHGGFLLDEERADVFTASLGNLKPGSAVDLSITYVTELAADGEAVRFTLPTTVSPRYAPAADQAGVGPTPAETLNPPVALTVPYGFSFEMDATMGGAIRGVQSPSHPIELELNGPRATVRLAQRQAAMDRDLVIVIAADNLSAPHAVVERAETGGAVALSFRTGGPDGRGDLRHRPLRLDERPVHRRGAQCAAVVPAIAHPRLAFQHRLVRVDVRGALRRKPGVRRRVARRRGGIRADARG
jgi:Ca-activated chloride channel family protein